MNNKHTALVLFDLDGTLADTAPDLAAVANRLRATHGLPPLPLEELRPFASQGARGLIGRALGVTPEHAEFELLRQQFFSDYDGALCVDTVLFPGMDATLHTLEAQGMRWGIVTNKVARFTDPLVQALGLARRAACVVSGDTAARAKPHPDPLLHALEVCGRSAAEAIYVGDDERDIQAGRAAGMRTVVAAYGYLGNETHYVEWQADAIVQSPHELLTLI